MLTAYEQNLHGDWMMFDFNRMWVRIAHIKIDADDYTDRTDRADGCIRESRQKWVHFLGIISLCCCRHSAYFWFDWLIIRFHPFIFIHLIAFGIIFVFEIGMRAMPTCRTPFDKNRTRKKMRMNSIITMILKCWMPWNGNRLVKFSTMTTSLPLMVLHQMKLFSDSTSFFLRHSFVFVNTFPFGRGFFVAVYCLFWYVWWSKVLHVKRSMLGPNRDADRKMQTEWDAMLKIYISFGLKLPQTLAAFAAFRRRPTNKQQRQQPAASIAEADSDWTQQATGEADSQRARERRGKKHWRRRMHSTLAELLLSTSSNGMRIADAATARWPPIGIRRLFHECYTFSLCFL